MSTIKTIMDNYDHKLPEEYLAFVRKIDNDTERYYKDDEEKDDYPERPWYLWGVDHLNKKINMKGVGIEPGYRILRLYTEVFAEFSGDDTIYSPNGNISLQRVASGFVFGEENGDYIYFDPFDGNSVWIYYHDGGDVKKISASFKEWLENSREA